MSDSSASSSSSSAQSDDASRDVFGIGIGAPPAASPVIGDAAEDTTTQQHRRTIDNNSMDPVPATTAQRSCMKITDPDDDIGGRICMGTSRLEEYITPAVSPLVDEDDNDSDYDDDNAASPDLAMLVAATIRDRAVLEQLDEIRSLKSQLRSAQRVEITGPNGSPVYARGNFADGDFNAASLQRLLLEEEEEEGAGVLTN
eukprot:CAMPEP_0181076908 /NCGR_PEP_ID=MMETSP1071-20121207/667_1 /TAXON_ID=35127 /ORGANISM="Thalassiosira sp., Strain NH16" /LENGTH=199 /DNA_ID=CAMNT_0023158115 /DNA_START=48 /DNA_END=644 /DNA_ORIENTATION=-